MLPAAAAHLASAVGQDALGSGRIGSGPLEEEDRDGGVKGVGAPLSSTTLLLGLTVILVPLFCGFSGCALALDHVGLSGDDDSRFPLCSLQP